MRINAEVLSGDVFEKKALVIAGKQLSDPKFTVLVRIPTAKGETVAQLVDRLNAEAAAEAGVKNPKLVTRWPFADGDEMKDAEDGERRRFPQQASGYAVARASSKFDITLVEGQNKTPLAVDHFFGGVRCQVVAKAGAYDGAGGKGVTLYLNGVWVLGPGKERFTTGGAADFEESSEVTFGEFADAGASFDLAS